MNATIACFSTGTLGPLLYSLSFRVRLFFLFSCPYFLEIVCLRFILDESRIVL